MTIKDRLTKLIPESRKLQLSYMALLALVGLALAGKISGEPLVWGVVGIVTAFSGGNGMEHFSKKDKPESPAQ